MKNQILVYSFVTSFLVSQSPVFGSSVHDNRHPKQATQNIEKGFGCGTVPVSPNRIIQIQSNNFGVGNYFNNEGCSWTFTATECTLSVYCPCFDLRTSFGCFEDYLKISHQQFFSNRFCGKTYPTGVYRATTNSLTVQFKSDSSGTAHGFLCYIRCTAPGMADPVVAPAPTCPPNSQNPFGFPA